MGKNKIPETGIYDARQLGRGRMLLLGFQHMFAMFGATVLVPILTGLDVSTTLLFAGLGTLLFHLITSTLSRITLFASICFSASQILSSDPINCRIKTHITFSCNSCTVAPKILTTIPST